LKALADYEKVIELEPKNWDYRTRYVSFLYWKNSSDGTLPDHQKGLAQARIAAELQPENPRSWSHLGQGFELVGDTAAARQSFEKSLEIDPLHSNGLNWQVQDLLRNGKLDQALAAVEKLVTVAPQDANNWWTLAEVHADLNQVDKAFEAFEKAITLAPHASHLYKERGDLHLALHHVDLAFADFNKALEVEPNAGYVHKRRAACCFRLARFDEALADLQQGVERTPGDLSNLTWIPVADIAACADVKFQEGMLRLADRCVELHKESVASLLARAQLLAELGEFAKASGDLKKSISKVPDSFYQQYQVALLSAKLEDLEGYRSQCQALVGSTTSTSQPITLHFAAWTSALAPNSLEDYSHAIELNRAAVKAEPTNSQFLNGMGAILMRAGMHAEAKPYLEGIVDSAEIDNTSKTYTHYFLAMTEHHLGQADAASAHLKTANELADNELKNLVGWNRRLTIELLRMEAQALIGNVDHQ
jgi:tetratricopeptide (TPR) repeat protein